MREIKQIIVHCSGGPAGDVKFLNRVATEKGFSGADGILGTDDDISYHYIILNGLKSADREYSAKVDGMIEAGRIVEQPGAHCKNENYDSIGICLIGTDAFTPAQMESLIALIERLRDRFGKVPVYGHYEKKSGIAQGKTCPNIDMKEFRTKWNLWV